MYLFIYLFILFIYSFFTQGDRSAEAGLTRTLRYKYQTYKNNTKWKIAHVE